MDASKRTRLPAIKPPQQESCNTSRTHSTNTDTPADSHHKDNSDSHTNKKHSSDRNSTSKTHHHNGGHDAGDGRSTLHTEHARRRNVQTDRQDVTKKPILGDDNDHATDHVGAAKVGGSAEGGRRGGDGGGREEATRRDVLRARGRDGEAGDVGGDDATALEERRRVARRGMVGESR
jgi:hypothetical protein